MLGGSLHPRDWSRYLPPVLANRFVLSLMGPKPSITESAHSVPGTRLKVRILGPIKCSHNNKGEVYFFFCSKDRFKDLEKYLAVISKV